MKYSYPYYDLTWFVDVVVCFLGVFLCSFCIHKIDKGQAQAVCSQDASSLSSEKLVAAPELTSAAEWPWKKAPAAGDGSNRVLSPTKNDQKMINDQHLINHFIPYCIENMFLFVCWSTVFYMLLGFHQLVQHRPMEIEVADGHQQTDLLGVPDVCLSLGWYLTVKQWSRISYPKNSLGHLLIIYYI